MSKIIKLDKNLANQIAAGEVVERPVSVVKELVENSIDAGASNIKVEIKQGGIKEIIITDDGFGVESSDLNIILDKYTTSKIKSLDDLYNVMTFGFRGEALSSISSVSKMKIVSKTISQTNGSYISVLAGEDKKFGEEALDVGTKIYVLDLFFNTPARLNYLKKPRTEYIKIKEFLEQISLSYPEIGFELYHDDSLVFKYRKSENLKTRIYNIYGDKFSENLLDINYDLVGLKISGYISDPKVCFSNKNKQLLLVNNRIIKSPLIMKSINDAYNRFIPHSEHPAYVLNINVDPTQVDVNVHPRKLEVRFAGEQQIFRGFYHAIEGKLNSVSLINNNTDSNNSSFDTIFQNTNSFSNNNSFKPSNRQESYYSGSGTKFKNYSPYTNLSPNPSQTRIDNSINFSKEILSSKENFDNKINDNSIGFEISKDLHDTPMGKIVGQVHNSFIIVQTKDGIQILDQHALAERVIYEKLISSKKSFSVQGLLISQSINLTTKELDILEQNKETFIEMGFEFEILGGSIVMVNGIPDFIKKENLSNIFTGILDDIGEHNFNKSTKLQEIRNKIFASTACRSAIKFGNKLNLFEMNKLLNDAVIDYSVTCPHGRPVVYEINLEELQNKYER